MEASIEVDAAGDGRMVSPPPLAFRLGEVSDSTPENDCAIDGDSDKLSNQRCVRPCSAHLFQKRRKGK